MNVLLLFRRRFSAGKVAASNASVYTEARLLAADQYFKQAAHYFLRTSGAQPAEMPAALRFLSVSVESIGASAGRKGCFAGFPNLPPAALKTCYGMGF